MPFHDCLRLQRQQQELNNKITITPLFIRQIHSTLSPLPFSLSGSLLIRFHVKILYAIFRCPSELHVRPKLFLLPGHFNQILYIHLLFPRAPFYSNFILPPLSHYTEAAGRCHMDNRTRGFLLLFSTPLSYVNRPKGHVAIEGYSCKYSCAQNLEKWRGLQGSIVN
jgi:hypothetical protein